MKGLRIVSTTAAAPKRLAPLPEDVERLLPYTTDAYAALSTPLNTTSRTRRRGIARWIGLSLIALSTFIMLGVATVIFVTRPGTTPKQQPVQAPVSQLRALGSGGADTLRCLADDMTVFVANDRVGDGVLVGTLSGPYASLRFTLDNDAGVRAAHILVDGGALRAATALLDRPMSIWPGETLLLQVDGVPEARRVRVTGGTSFGSREREVCQ